MADFTGPAQVSFAGGAPSVRTDTEQREAIQFTLMQCQSVDPGSTGAGVATITSGMTTQGTGYQISAAITNFTTVTPGVTGNGNTPTAAAVLPQTSRPEPLSGLLVYVANTSANPFNLFPHPNDPNNSINGQATNAPIIIGVNTVTAVQCYTPGVWQADGIGEGFAGSLATIVSQGNIVSAGSSSATATPITQAMVNFTSGAAAPAGGTLPPAKAGLQVAVMNSTANPTITIYGAGTDTVNGGASQTVPNSGGSASAQITIFYCFTNGVWFTK